MISGWMLGCRLIVDKKWHFCDLEVTQKLSEIDNFCSLFANFPFSAVFLNLGVQVCYGLGVDVN